MNAKHLFVCFTIALAAACSTTPTTPSTPAQPANANIAGNWLLTVETPMGQQDATMTVNQNGKEISGRLESQIGNVDYAGTIEGNDIKFTYDVSSLGAPAGSIFSYEGKLESGAMQGKAKFASFGEGTWSAKRK